MFRKRKNTYYYKVLDADGMLIASGNASKIEYAIQMFHDMEPESHTLIIKGPDGTDIYERF